MALRIGEVWTLRYMCYNQIGPCARNTYKITESIVNTVWEGLCNDLKRKIVFSFNLLKCVHLKCNDKVEITIHMIHNCEPYEIKRVAFITYLTSWVMLHPTTTTTTIITTTAPLDEEYLDKIVYPCMMLYETCSYKLSELVGHSHHYTCMWDHVRRD